VSVGRKVWRGPVIGLALVTGLASAGCSKPHRSPDRTPPSATGVAVTSGTSALPSANPPTSTSPPPPVPSGSGSGSTGGAGQPPVVWIGGTLDEIGRDRLVITEAFGSVVTLQQLGQGATAFFQIVGGAWEQLSEPSSAEVGQPACVEVLLNGQTLLALRVFLGATCGPA
jgi:hypothetical protein